MRASGRGIATHLQQLQLLQPLLYQLLNLPLVLHCLVLPERIPRPPFGVFSEVVGRELFALPEKLSVLYLVRSQGQHNDLPIMKIKTASVWVDGRRFFVNFFHAPPEIAANPSWELHQGASRQNVPAIGLVAASRL